MPDDFGGPRCPNHHVVLIRTNKKGLGICPISDARFEYKATEGEKKMVIDASGNLVERKEYNVIGND